MTDEIVEGIRCRYAHEVTSSFSASEGACVLWSWSPQFGVSVGNESTCLFDESSDSISSVSIKHGNLVDSITLHYSSGRVVRAGGSGGDVFKKVDIDVNSGERVLGFFGGNKVLIYQHSTLLIVF